APNKTAEPVAVPPAGKAPAPTSAADTPANAAPAAAPAAAAVAPSPAQPSREDRPAIDEKAFSKAHASPSIRKFARELGADLGKITGTGVKGRITQDDVKAHVKRLVTAASTAARLQASWLNLPHVTQHEDADITDLEEARAALKSKASQEGVRLTPLVFIIKACILALKEFPRLNASLDEAGENLVFKKYYNIGFAADTPNGLGVPVITNADQLDTYAIARTLASMSEKARTGKLKAAEMHGGSFTISSLGGIGGTYFTPIINAPEVAVLGVSKAMQTPVYERGAFIPRLMLPLSFSYDHRVIDGAEAARFVVFLAKTLGDVKALL